MELVKVNRFLQKNYPSPDGLVFVVAWCSLLCPGFCNVTSGTYRCDCESVAGFQLSDDGQSCARKNYACPFFRRPTENIDYFISKRVMQTLTALVVVSPVCVNLEQPSQLLRVRMEAVIVPLIMRAFCATN